MRDRRPGGGIPTPTAEHVLHTNPPTAVAPDVPADCPATFGNTDIYGGGFPDPTP